MVTLYVTFELVLHTTVLYSRARDFGLRVSLRCLPYPHFPVTMLVLALLLNKLALAKHGT